MYSCRPFTVLFIILINKKIYFVAKVPIEH